MSVQPKTILAWISLCLIVLLALWLTQYHRFPQFQRAAAEGGAAGGTQPRAGSNGRGDSGKETRKAAVVAGLVRMLTTPITFHGTVVDQFGQPVPGAEVGFSLLDTFNASGSTGKTTADQNGRIHISGIRGAVITVGVSKPGYYGVEGKSALSFAYGTPPDDYRLPAPTEKSPAKFLLHKKGRPAALIHAKLTNHDMLKDGTTVRIDLATGQASPSGEFWVQAWTSPPETKNSRFYSWRCRVSIPGGGLIERTDELDFLAPTDGYKDFVEVAYTNDRENWWPRFESEYFVRTKDNRHARVGFYFTSGGNHFCWLETYLNPVPGDRNLEFDENKQWQP